MAIGMYDVSLYLLEKCYFISHSFFFKYHAGSTDSMLDLKKRRMRDEEIVSLYL
jgi:hypothetical protein